MRQPNLALEIAASFVGGFAASLLTFTIAPYMSTQRHAAQLLAGDPAANREFPTTLNTMQAAINGENPILSSMGTYGWWVMVTIVALIATFVLFRFTRRYI